MWLGHPEIQLTGCRLRLTALFALRYEQKGAAATNALLQRLRSLGIPNEMLDVVPTLLRHCGQASRVADLYSDRSFTTRFATRARANLRVRVCAVSAIHHASWVLLGRPECGCALAYGCRC